jgi:hypothetical protein
MLLAGNTDGTNRIPGYVAFFKQLADDGGTRLNPPDGFLLSPPADVFDQLMVRVGVGQDSAFFPAENNAFGTLGAAVNSNK